MSFTLCPACHLPSERMFSSLPCEECLAGLLVAPPICPTCLGFTCDESGKKCGREWIRVEGDPAVPTRFVSLQAAYLSLGPGFRVLKSWKTTRNPALDRTLAAGVARAIAIFASHPEVVLVPVPQSPARQWELHGGSTLRLCALISAVRKRAGQRTWICEALRVPADPTSQAKTKGSERYRRHPAFESVLHPGTYPSRAPYLLVDDFLTSGTTLRSALLSLRKNGFQQDFHAFVLGFRPSL